MSGSKLLMRDGKLLTKDGKLATNTDECKDECCEDDGLRGCCDGEICTPSETTCTEPLVGKCRLIADPETSFESSLEDCNSLGEDWEYVCCEEVEGCVNRTEEECEAIGGTWLDEKCKAGDCLPCDTDEVPDVLSFDALAIDDSDPNFVETLSLSGTLEKSGGTWVSTSMSGSYTIVQPGGTTVRTCGGDEELCHPDGGTNPNHRCEAVLQCLNDVWFLCISFSYFAGDPCEDFRHVIPAARLAESPIGSYIERLGPNPCDNKSLPNVSTFEVSVA